MIVLNVAYALVSVAATGAAAAAGSSHAMLGMSTAMCCVYGLSLPVAALGVGLWNRAYLVSQRGFSIGQGVTRLKVVDAQGGLLPFGAAALRLLAQVGLGMVPLAGLLDLLWPLWDPQRQTLHDKAVGCFVIKNPSGL
jgi:uncharacterized RDD family membrane protein YckC